MKKEIKTGLFAVIVMAAALFAVEYLKGKDIFSKTATYYIIYPTVDGIGISTPVTVGGYAAGRVSDLRYNPKTMDYTVAVSIARDFVFPEDSRMEVYSSDIMGTRKIKVVAGESETRAASGDTLEGIIGTDMISSLAGSIGPVAVSLDTLVHNLNSAVTSVNGILNEENISRITGIIRNLETMTDALGAIADTVKGKSPDISLLIARFRSISERLDSASAAAAATVSNTEAITASLKDARLGETVDSLRSLLAKIQDPSGSIGKLITTDSLYDSVSRLSRDIDSLVRGIENDPKKYIKISVF